MMCCLWHIKENRKKIIIPHAALCSICYLEWTAFLKDNGTIVIIYCITSFLWILCCTCLFMLWFDFL